MKTVILALVATVLLALSSCGIQKHVSFNVVHTPVNPNDTISVEGSFWGLIDLVNDNINQKSKFGVFVYDVSNRCNLQLAHSPKDLNDTITFRLTCDSLSTKAQEYIKKAKK